MSRRWWILALASAAALAGCDTDRVGPDVQDSAAVADLARPDAPVVDALAPEQAAADAPGPDAPAADLPTGDAAAPDAPVVDVAAPDLPQQDQAAADAPLADSAPQDTAGADGQAVDAVAADGAAADNGGCAGCRQPVTKICKPGSSVLACGKGGGACMPCVTALPCRIASCVARTCVFPTSPDTTPCQGGGGRCISGVCCKGCVTGAACEAGNSIAKCGASGESCKQCQPPSNPCQLASCLFGKCAAVNRKDGAICPGGKCKGGKCCTGCLDSKGNCQAGTAVSLCGKESKACAKCSTSNPCLSAKCVAGVCSTATLNGASCPGGKCLNGGCCKGCISGFSCVPGTATDKCGKYGATCNKCTVPGNNECRVAKCTNRVCTAPAKNNWTPCSSNKGKCYGGNCCTGCIQSGKCMNGDTVAACGKGGLEPCEVCGKWGWYCNTNKGKCSCATHLNFKLVNKKCKKTCKQWLMDNKLNNTGGRSCCWTPCKNKGSQAYETHNSCKYCCANKAGGGGGCS